MRVVIFLCSNSNNLQKQNYANSFTGLYINEGPIMIHVFPQFNMLLFQVSNYLLVHLTNFLFHSCHTK